MEQEKRRPGWVRTFLALVVLVVGVGIWTSVATAMGDPLLLGEIGTLAIFVGIFVVFFRSKASSSAKTDPPPPPREPTVRR
jgi:uncharacterized membrane protein HdeD (DUF308 family)